MSKDGSRSPVHNRSVSSLQSMGSSGSSNLSVQMSEDGTEGENMISGTEEDEATDYVFRIITTFKPENLRECTLSQDFFICTVNVTVFVPFKNEFSKVLWCSLYVTLERSEVPPTKTMTLTVRVSKASKFKLAVHAVQLRFRLRLRFISHN